jgi:hypothetical protein
MIIKRTKGNNGDLGLKDLTKRQNIDGYGIKEEDKKKRKQKMRIIKWAFSNEKKKN